MLQSTDWPAASAPTVRDEVAVTRLNGTAPTVRDEVAVTRLDGPAPTVRDEALPPRTLMRLPSALAGIFPSLG